MSNHTNSFGKKFANAATWQGYISYSLFSIYVVNHEIFMYYVGRNVGPFLLANMLFGNGVHIYTRPAMKRLRRSYRIIYSIYGTYTFNFPSVIIFLILDRNFFVRPLFVTILSYAFGQFLYSMFHSHLYFVDKCAFPESRRDSSFMDIIFSFDNVN